MAEATIKNNQNVDADHKNLEYFDGRGKHSDPEFVWQILVGVRAIKCLNSTRIGETYENCMIVGDINNGILYHFDLSENRTGLALD